MALSRFFLPGPTEVRPEVLDAQARPMMAHRGDGFVALMGEVQQGLKEVFRTQRPVIVSTSSATGLMEAGIRNSGTGPVLSLVNGAFSSRFADIARSCGRAVDVVEVPWGAVHDPSVVSHALAGKAYDAVTVVHSETSTGALNPVADIAAVVAGFAGPLLLVDSVTGVGGAEILTDAWGLDFVLTGSHKALALPPGLAFGVASERMLERAAQTPGRGHYFDLVAHVRHMEGFQTPTTPALTLLYALQAQLGFLADEGMEARWGRHHEMAQRTWQWAREAASETGVPVSVLAPEGARSPTVTTLCPEGIPPDAIVSAMGGQGWVLGRGYGKIKDTTFRIGHMGNHTVEGLDALLARLSETLRVLST